MSAQCEVTGKRAAGNPMGLFERYLTLWVFLCIGVGILLNISKFSTKGEYKESSPRSRVTRRRERMA